MSSFYDVNNTVRVGEVGVNNVSDNAANTTESSADCSLPPPPDFGTMIAAETCSYQRQSAGCDSMSSQINQQQSIIAAQISPPASSSQNPHSLSPSCVLESPRVAARSPGGPVPRPADTSGTLRTTIQLGKTGASIVHTGPFYLIQDPVGENDITGATNLMSYHNLEHSYNKFNGKKMKDSLSSFLTNLPGVLDTPGASDNSSLRCLIEKPPVVGKELLPLTNSQLSGFRLHAGPLPEQFRFMSHTPSRRRHKHKRHRQQRVGISAGAGGDNSSIDGAEGGMGAAGEQPEKKHKKRRNDEENQRRKKKKEKKKKKRHSPEHPSSAATTGNGVFKL